jgi:ketosteroid isomerase-like protein
MDNAPAMSQENVEVVKAIFRGWDAAGVDGMLPFIHEDIEYRPVEERGSVHGHDGLRRYFERWLDSWDEFQADPTEFLHARDYVCVGVAMSGHGRTSGVEVRKSFWQVWLIRQGKAARWEEYENRAEALETAGLSEQDAHVEST